MDRAAINTIGHCELGVPLLHSALLDSRIGRLVLADFHILSLGGGPPCYPRSLRRHDQGLTLFNVVMKDCDYPRQPARAAQANTRGSALKLTRYYRGKED